MKKANSRDKCGCCCCDTFLGSQSNGFPQNLLNRLNGTNQHAQTSSGSSSNSHFYNESTTPSSLEYHLRETEQLLEISLLKKKLRDTERAMEQIISDMGIGNATDKDDDEKDIMDVTMAQVR